ncbi:MAG TPA: histidine--tRNA ligase [Dehalococcoidia bacterium]|nr:histidine--tRNA ligase [Dehalococcoidia bacterium]
MADSDSFAKAQKFLAPRGTADVLPDEWAYWRFVRDTAERVCESFGYRRIETPVFGHAGVWLRTSGSGTDIVEKEMYLFEDRGGDQLALRPEGTADVMRSYVEHGMASLPQPVRLYYVAPNFRYDRPQAGRYRQHTQLGVEAVGDPDALLDAEVIDVLRTFFTQLGLRDYTIKLNTIGDMACRPAYVEALRGYYRPLLSQVCDDCRTRFEKNPLRLLDCKEERCQPAIAGAPRLHDYLCQDCRDHFQRLRDCLAALDIEYAIDERLVRGLDYYTRTVFEFHPAIEGAQSSMGSGGRYDGLIELLGGPPTPGVGFGSGFERLILNLKRQEAEIPLEQDPTLFIALVAAEAAPLALRLADRVRSEGLQVVIGSPGRSLRTLLRHADQKRASYVAIIGRKELDSGDITLRAMHDHTERTVGVDEVADAVRP